MDAPAPNPHSRARTSRRVAIVFAAALFLAVLFFLPRIQARLRAIPPAANPDSTAVVEQKDFSRVIRLTGTTQAAHSFVVLAPQLEGAQFSTMVITSVVGSGAKITKGDTLVQFDPQAQMKDFLEKQNQLSVLVGQLEQKRSDEEIAKAKDETEIEAASNALKKAQLEVQKNEIMSLIDAEKNQETLEESKTTLAQLKETFTLKRKSATAAIRILELQRDRAQEAMRYAQSNAGKMTIKSPMDGVAVLSMTWLNGRMGTAQTGDTVRSGVAFMQVVDPSQMEVRVLVNQADFPILQRGQPANIHLDAYPGLVLPAELEEISPLGQQGQFVDSIRNFSTRFKILGSDPRILPDLSVAVDVELQHIPGALVAPVQSVTHEGGADFVWLKSAAGFSKREVRIGARNDTEAVILAGLSRGDVIRSTAPASAPEK